jgi:hypothetical protein
MLFSFSFAALSATLARITTFLPRRSKLAETALIAMAGLAEPGLAGAVALAFRVPVALFGVGRWDRGSSRG